MKNVIEKGLFWGPMAFTLVVLAMFYLVGGVPLTLLLIGAGWLFFIAVLSLFKGLKKEEVKAVNNQGAAFVKVHFIELSDNPPGAFNSIMEKGRLYLVIAKFKWVIGLFLLLASLFYLFRSASPSFVRPVFGEMVVDFSALATIFTGIAFGFIILVMWLATKLPRICYKKADFYVMPKEAKGEEGKSIEIAKNVVAKTIGVGLMTIVRGPRKYFLTENDLLILPEDNYILPGEPVSGKVLHFGGEPVLQYMRLEEGDIKEDFKEEKPIVIQ